LIIQKSNRALKPSWPLTFLAAQRAKTIVLTGQEQSPPPIDSAVIYGTIATVNVNAIMRLLPTTTLAIE